MIPDERLAAGEEARPPRLPNGCFTAPSWERMLNLPPGSVAAGATATPFGYGGQLVIFRVC